MIRDSLEPIEIENWRLQTDMILFMCELHDEEYRRTNPKPIDAITYEDGKWVCEAMVKSREKNKEIKKVLMDSLLDAPFLSTKPETLIEFIKNGRC